MTKLNSLLCATALVTPMHANGHLDLASFKHLLNWQLEHGAQALVVAGSTGESVSLNFIEYHQLLEVAVAEAKGRALIIAASGCATTANSVTKTKLAQQLGADACLVVTPYYLRPTIQGLVAHFKKVADSSNLPIIIYTVPQRTGIDIDLKILMELAKISNIVAVKDAANNALERLAEFRAHFKDRLAFFGGDDRLAANYVAQGGNGVISVVANIAPKFLSEQLNAKQANITLYDKLFEFLSIEVNPIPIKALMAQIGLVANNLREPLLPMSLESHKDYLNNLVAELAINPIYSKINA